MAKGKSPDKRRCHENYKSNGTRQVNKAKRIAKSILSTNKDVNEIAKKVCDEYRVKATRVTGKANDVADKVLKIIRTKLEKMGKIKKG